jgi:hypothetical protein
MGTTVIGGMVAGRNEKTPAPQISTAKPSLSLRSAPNELQSVTTRERWTENATYSCWICRQAASGRCGELQRMESGHARRGA